MSGSPDRVDAVVDAMLHDTRPHALAATPDEIEALRMAAALSAAREGACEPAPEFVEALAGRLRAATEAPIPAPPPAPPQGVGGEPLQLRTGRRSFLRAAGLAAAAAAVGVIGDRAVEQGRTGSGPPASAGTTADALVPEGAIWRDVAALADVHSAGPIRFRAGAVEGVVALGRDGGVTAVSAICTHMGCVLDVEFSGQLRCPCHGARFGIDGTPGVNAYPVAPLPQLRSRVVGDRVQVLA